MLYFTGRREWKQRVVCLTTLLLLAAWACPRVAGQVMQCLGTDGCRCTLDDGSVIDVSSIGNADGTPTFDKVMGQDSYYYSVNPCHPFTQSSCVDAAVCQVTSDLSTFYPAGDASSAEWAYDGTSAMVYYQSDTDAFRQSWVTYTCDQSASTPQLVATGELGMSTYYFEIKTKCACPNGCGPSDGGGNEGGGLSLGSILLIIFFSLLIVYVAAGMVFNRARRQATGVDMIPNVPFWLALPSLIKDGFVFTISKFRGSKGGYSEVK